MATTTTQPSLLTRALRALARGFLSAHVWIYRRTGGGFGGSMGPNKVLLLTTVGRKTGRQRTWPLVYFQDGERVLVVASNGGADQHPAWFLNLQSNPRATIQIQQRQLAVQAAAASGADRERLWGLIVAAGPQFAQYQTNTQREIPVVVLTPVTL